MVDGKEKRKLRGHSWVMFFCLFVSGFIVV